MRSRRQTFLRNLFFQLFFIGMGLANGVLLVPLYLKHIPSDLYGAWGASGNVLAWMTAVDPGISTILQQRVAAAYGAKDKGAISGWIATGFWITAAICSVIVAAGCASSLFLGDWMNLPPEVDRASLESAFRWSVLGSALMVLSFSVTAVNQGLQSSLGIGTISIGVSILRLVAVIVLVKNGFGLLAIAIPLVGMGALLLVFNLMYLRSRLTSENIPFSWLPTRLRELAGMIYFASFGRVATVLATNADLFLVARLLGPESVNILRFTRTAPDASRAFVERPYAAVQPTLSHLLGEGGTERAREILVRLVALTLLLFGLLVSGFVAFNDVFVSLWVGANFYAGPVINSILIAGFLASTSAGILAAMCFAAGNIRANSLVNGAQAFLYIPMLWIGGRFFGMTGVVTAGLVSVVLTQGWYLPAAFVRIYGIARPERLRFVRTGVVSAASGMGCVVMFGRCEPQTWAELALCSTLFGACYLVAVVLLLREAREEFLRALSWIRARFPKMRA